jgi:hypothetical protein
MSKSNYLENKVNDHVLGGPDYTRPATVYVSLHTADPTDAGTGAEATGSGYARKAVTNNATNWPASVNGSKSNGTEIAFDPATGSWSSGANQTHFGIWDALSGGNLLRYGALTTPKAFTTGDTPKFAAGTLVCTED